MLSSNILPVDGGKSAGVKTAQTKIRPEYSVCYKLLNTIQATHPLHYIHRNQNDFVQSSRRDILLIMAPRVVDYVTLLEKCRFLSIFFTKLVREKKKKENDQHTVAQQVNEKKIATSLFTKMSASSFYLNVFIVRKNNDNKKPLQTAITLGRS